MGPCTIGEFEVQQPVSIAQVEQALASIGDQLLRHLKSRPKIGAARV